MLYETLKQFFCNYFLLHAIFMKNKNRNIIKCDYILLIESALGVIHRNYIELAGTTPLRSHREYRLPHTEVHLNKIK